MGTVKLKRIGKLLTMYNAIAFTVPLEISSSEQFTISNKNVWSLLLLMTHWRDFTPQLRHEHVSAW